MLVHEDEGNLGLQNIVDHLAQNRIALFCHSGLIGGDGLVGLLLRAEQTVVGGLAQLCPVIRLHGLVRIVGDGLVPMLDREPVIDGIVYHVVVIRIIDLLVHNGLDIRILGGIDGKSSGVQKIGCLGLRIAQLFLEGGHDLLRQLVREIGIGSLAFLGHKIHVLDPGVDVVCQGLLLLLFGDLSLLIHILEDHPALFLVVFPAFFRQGIIFGGVLGDAGNDRTLGKRQVRNVLIKIAAGCDFDTQGVIA